MRMTKSKIARSSPLGLPGGPCHIIRNISEEPLPERLKQELIEDVEKGRDLSNAQADKVYKKVVMPSKIDLFATVELTSHAQYRMDLRGITTSEVQKAFREFERWFQARKSDKAPRSQDMRLIEDIAYGKPVQFDAQRLGLTLVFVVDNRKARLVSTWWTGLQNPPKPRPGECEYIPYLDQDRNVGRPRILGGSVNAVIKKAKALYEFTSRIACGGDCGCGGSCGGSCGCSGSCSVQAEGPISDPSSWYEDSVMEETLENSILLPKHGKSLKVAALSKDDIESLAFEIESSIHNNIYSTDASDLFRSVLRHHIKEKPASISEEIIEAVYSLKIPEETLNLYTVNETGPAWLGVLKNLNKIVKRKYDIELPPLGIFSKIKGKPATDAQLKDMGIDRLHEKLLPFVEKMFGSSNNIKAEAVTLKSVVESELASHLSARGDRWWKAYSCSSGWKYTDKEYTQAEHQVRDLVLKAMVR